MWRSKRNRNPSNPWRVSRTKSCLPQYCGSSAQIIPIVGGCGPLPLAIWNRDGLFSESRRVRCQWYHICASSQVNTDVQALQCVGDFQFRFWSKVIGTWEAKYCANPHSIGQSILVRVDGGSRFSGEACTVGASITWCWFL